MVSRVDLRWEGSRLLLMLRLERLGSFCNTQITHQRSYDASCSEWTVVSTRLVPLRDTRKVVTGEVTSSYGGDVIRHSSCAILD
jgi:hypothetical protein